MNMNRIFFFKYKRQTFKLTATVANGVKMHFLTPFQSHFCHFGYLIQNDSNIKLMFRTAEIFFPFCFLAFPTIILAAHNYYINRQLIGTRDYLRT